MLGFHDALTVAFQNLSNTSRDQLIQRVFEEDAFETVAEMTRRLLARACPRLVEICAFAKNLQRLAGEQATGSSNGEMRRVIRERADFKRHAERAPTGMNTRGNRIHQVMYVDGEVQQPTRLQNAR